MSDRALLSLKVPCLRLPVLIRVVFKTTVRISMEHMCCVIDRVAGKYYCTWCKNLLQFNIVRHKSGMYCARINPGTAPQLSIATLRPQSVPRKEHAIFTHSSSFLHLFSLGS